MRRVAILAAAVAGALAGACGAGSEPAATSSGGTAERSYDTAGGESGGASETAPRIFPGGPPPPAEPEPDPGLAIGDDQRVMLVHEDELHQTLAMSQPDCGRARGLRDDICELAERICDIAARHPGEPGVAGQCADGRERCDRASADVAAACGE